MDTMGDGPGFVLKQANHSLCPRCMYHSRSFLTLWARTHKMGARVGSSSYSRINMLSFSLDETGDLNQKCFHLAGDGMIVKEENTFLKDLVMGEEDAQKLEAPVPVKEEVDETQKLAVASKKDGHKPHTPSPEKVDMPATAKSPARLIDRDTALARLETEKHRALVKAWEENEKAKAENRAHKKIIEIGTWENTKRAAVEMKLKKMEEELQMKKAEYRERMKNTVAGIHKDAEVKKATVEAQRGEELHRIEETAAKYRTSGYVPKQHCFGCF